MDTTEAKPEARIEIKRSRYMLGSGMQRSVALQLLAVVSAIALLHGLALLALGREIRLLSASETRLLFVGFGVFYWLVAIAVVGGAALLLTHRIAGPALVIERAVRALARGDSEPRLQLRPRDYLRSLSDSVLELRVELREQAEQRGRVLRELAAYLRDADARAALECLEQLGIRDEKDEVGPRA